VAQKHDNSAGEEGESTRRLWLGFRFDRITNRLALLALWIMVSVPALIGLARLAVKEDKDVVSCGALLIIAASLVVIGRPGPDPKPVRVPTRTRRGSNDRSARRGP
jgi:hypothetical protein